MIKKQIGSQKEDISVMRRVAHLHSLFTHYVKKLIPFTFSESL